MTNIKLNIGCGPTGKINGFVNIDNSKSILLHRWPMVKKTLHKFGLLSKTKFDADWSGVRYMDASRHLPYSSGAVTKIYSSHFLEHIPLDKGTKVLRECFRTLQSGGVMRLVLPDLLWHAERYVSETNSLMQSGEESFTSQYHDKFLDTVYGAYLEPARFGLLHCYMYDFPTVSRLLFSVGFRDIRLLDYQSGDNELSRHDNRPEDSMHIECLK